MDDLHFFPAFQICYFHFVMENRSDFSLWFDRMQEMQIERTVYPISLNTAMAYA